MSNFFDNRMKVCGSRKDLEKFKSDMAGDQKNGLLSFQNVIPEPADTSEWKNEYRYSSEMWKAKHWGCPSDALFLDVKDEGECLTYHFATWRSECAPIYIVLMENYYLLNFEIEYNCEVTSDSVELASINGKIIKKILFYWDGHDLEDGKFKDILYRKDFLKNTVEVVEERIAFLDEYDEANHRWVK